MRAIPVTVDGRRARVLVVGGWGGGGDVTRRLVAWR